MGKRTSEERGGLALDAHPIKKKTHELQNTCL